jgi:hypothetical protein
MYNSKDDEVKEIESLGFTQMTGIEIQEFEEHMALDEDFRRFIHGDRSTVNNKCKDEGLMVSEIETEDGYRILREEQSYSEHWE